MAIEIFGFIVKPEISIGDIAGIGALIASPLIFWFGYSRTRKSEQIKIARDLMDRIDVKLRNFKEIDLLIPDPSLSEEGAKKIFDVKRREVFRAIYDMAQEIEYFSYLIKINEIRDQSILKYQITRIGAAFEEMERSLDDLKTLGLDTLGLEVDTLRLETMRAFLTMIKRSIKVWEDKYRLVDLSMGLLDHD